jgi:hypothetical protein
VKGVSVFRVALLAESGDGSARAILRQRAKAEVEQGKDTYDQRYAAKKLAVLKDEDIAPTLLKMLKSDDKKVRESALEGLGALGDNSHLERIKPFLKDKDEDLAEAALTATLKLDPRALSGVTEYNVARTLYNVTWKPSGRIGYGDRRFNAEVNLSTHFASDIAIQSGGSCHIFAASALFSEACYRKTGKWVDMSEAYLFSQHLRAEFGGRSRYGVAEHKKESGLGMLTALDGGDAKIAPGDTLDRMLEGKTCSRDCFPFDATFREAIREPIRKNLGPLEERLKVIEETAPVGNEELRETKKQRREFVTRWYEGRVPGEVCGSLRDHETGHLRKQTPEEEAAIRNCIGSVGRYVVKKEREFDVGDLLGLLDRGIPILCVGTFEFGPGSEGGHASMLVGYRYNRTSPHITWFFRDSNSKSVKEGTVQGDGSACRRIYYFP